MKHRLFHPPPIHTDQDLELDRERGHYLTRVLRLRRGEEIVCFDGAGRGWVATLAAATPRSATLRIGALIVDEPPPDPQLHLVQGLLKGAAMDSVVHKATELGATDVWLIHADRSNVPADPERLERKRGHWQRIMESSAEQCGAYHLPRLHAARSLDDWLTAAPAATLIVVDPGAPPLPLSLPRLPVAVLIGPEGGWSEAERHAAAAAGALRYGLGARVLRAETAPLAVLTAVRHGWGWR